MMISGSKQAPNYQTIKHFKKNNSAPRVFSLKIESAEFAPRRKKSAIKL
jgi:hypothetical protein